MRGRKPISTSLKILAGNPGHRPINAREPQPSRELPTCPEWLDDAAQEEWHRLAPELARMGVLTLVDGAALAGYCQAYADLRDAVETLRETGKTLVTDKGNFVAHPAVGQKNRALMLLAKFLSEFGLSPASRSRVKAGADEPRDEFEDFMRATG